MIDKKVIKELEESRDTEVFGQTPGDFLKETLMDIQKYQEVILDMYILPMGEPEKYKELDSYRTIKHNKVITDLNILRRGAAKLGFPDPFTDTAFENRHDYAVAAFALLTAILSEN